jgi:hypothetical protein
MSPMAWYPLSKFSEAEAASSRITSRMTMTINFWGDLRKKIVRKFSHGFALSVFVIVRILFKFILISPHHEK